LAGAIIDKVAPASEEAMHLTIDQQKAIEDGQAVPLVVEGTECVLLRKDLYDRVKTILEYDDSEWTESETSGMAAIAAEEADKAEPIL
jgi:hypothetical protein